MAFVIGTPSRSSYGSFNKMVGSLGKSPIGSPHMFNQYMQSMELNNMKTYDHERKSSLALKPVTEQNLLDPTFVKRKSKMDMLHLATPAAQQMRLKLIAGSVIVFLNSGYKGKRFIYEKARDLGVVSVIIDNHGSWSEKLVEDGVIKKFIGVDMNAKDIEAQIVAIINGLDDEGLSVDGVTTFWETAVPLAARVAEALGLPGNPHDAIEAAKNKHQTRARMSKGKLPTPRNYLISSDVELKAAADIVGFPAVLKPIEGLLSIGVVRVESEIHLRKVFQDVTEQMDGMYMTRDGGMASIRPGEKLPDGAHPLKTKLMLEEYLDGIEVDVDIVLTGGEPVYCKVTDNWPTLEPWFNETGDNSPSVLSEGHQRELEALCVGSLKCLGFKCGVFHVEAKYTTRGPRLIEINSRMGGGQVRENNLAVWGVDLVDESLMTAIGLPCHPPVPSGPYTCRSALYFNSKQTGIMGPLDWLANVRKLPNVVYARLLVGDGDEVMCAEDGLPTWLGQIMCEGETPEEAIAWVNKYEEMVEPDIIPQGGEVPLRCLLPIDFSTEDTGFLKSPTQEAQDYRLSLLRDRVVVFISAGYEGKKFIFERAKQHGLMSIIIDNPGSWSEGLEADGIIKKFIPIDLNASRNQVVSQIVAAVKKLPREGLPPSGVMTFWETAVPLAARVAEGLGCVCNTSKAIDAAKNKHETRRMMSEAGLPTPRNFLIESVDQLPAAAKLVGFPAVLKPTVGLLSIGVVRVNDEEHLLGTYKETEAVMADTFLTKDGSMGKLSDCDGVLPRGASPLNCAMMLEEYLDGTEIDCDVVMSGGEAVYSKITDNWPTMEPWFNETGDNVPSLLPTEQVVALEKLCVDTLKCLGFQTGVFHVEAKYTTRGPRLIEVNSRMGGGQVHENNKAVWGTDLVDESLLASIGIPNAPPAPEKPLTCRSALYFNAPRSGVMGPGDWLKEVRSKPGVVYAKLMVKEGDAVQCAAHGLPTWLGQIMCDAPTAEEAMALVKAYEAEIVAPILDKPAKAIVVPKAAVVAAPKSDGFTPTGSPAAASNMKKPTSKSSGGGLSAAFGSKTNLGEAKKGAEPKLDSSWGN